MKPLKVGRINQEIVEYTFDPAFSGSYRLSLLVGADSVYYLIGDAQNKALALRSFHFDERPAMTRAAALNEAIAEDANLRLRYHSVKTAVYSPHFTLVPQKFYDPARIASYFSLLTPVPPSSHIAADFISAFELFNVFFVEKTLLDELKAAFPDSAICHSSASFIESCARAARDDASLQLFLNIRDGRAQFCLFDFGRLLYANAFSFEAPQDVAYYTLAIYEQFKMNPEMSPLGLSGSVTKDSDIFAYLYRFVREVNFLTAPDALSFGQQFVGVPPHFYFDLYNGLLCE